MSTAILERIDGWRTEATEDNPAGPLFSSRYAEADLSSQSPAMSDTRLSGCSGSGTIQCC